MTQRHSSVQHVVDLLRTNPNLPEKLHSVAYDAELFAGKMLDQLGDGPELTAGLRKLLEAKDCFVRQALIDGKTR